MLSVRASMLGTVRLCFLTRASTFKPRHIVSAAYSLQQEWNARLESPVLKTVDAKQLVLTMHQQGQAQTPIAPIDMDILANRLVNLDLTMLPTFETVLSAFRNSQSCLRALPSTYHAIVRGLIELGELRRLVTLLANKDEFGVFLDAHAACIAIRHALVDSNDLESAARIASDFLLQERGHLASRSQSSVQEQQHFEADVFANCVAFGALHRFIVSLQEAGGESKLLGLGTDESSQPADPTDDIVEWVRVDAVRNPVTFDWLNLFRFENRPATLGYAALCFVHALRSVTGNDDRQLATAYRCSSASVADAIACNYELIALALLRRTNEANRVLANAKPSTLCAETVRICEAAGFKLSDAIKNGARKESLKQLGEEFVADAVKRCEATQVQHATRLYSQWQTRRSEELEAHGRRFATERRRSELKSQLATLLETEELLTFFSKQKEIELRAWLAPRSRAESKRRSREQYEEELRNVLKEKARIKSYLEALPTD